MSHPDEPLLDQTFVVRGGLMELPGLSRAVHTAYHLDGVFELSFFGKNGLTVEEIAEAANLPHAQIRVSTIGRLRSLDCELVRDGEPPHLALRFVLRPTDSELENLEAAFDPPIANPALAD